MAVAAEEVASAAVAATTLLVAVEEEAIAAVDTVCLMGFETPITLLNPLRRRRWRWL